LSSSDVLVGSNRSNGWIAPLNAISKLVMGNPHGGRQPSAITAGDVVVAALDMTLPCRQ
jgi:hypothetical protein